MSKNSYSRVGGENVRLLQALIDEAPSYTKPTNSRNANILKSIINNTEYNEPPQSEIEELLIALKAKIGGEIEVNELTVTENGSYDAGLNKAYNPVNVELPLDSKEITANGTYNASDDNLAGFSQVTVNVEGYKLKDIPNTPTAIATFSDGSDLPMPKLEVGIEPVQSGSGDPSPENIRPIIGWDEVNVTRTGKNWCPTAIADNVVYKNGEYAINLSFNDGIITFETTANISAFFLLKAFKITKQHIGKTFTMSYSATPSLDDNQCILVLNDNGTRTNLDKSATITADMVGKELTMRFYKYGIGTYTISNIQLEVGSQATSYEPYNGQVYTIKFKDSQGNPITVYGSSHDLVSGVMTVDRAYVDLGDLNFVYYENNKRFAVQLNDGKPSGSGYGLNTALCECYPVVTSQYSSMADSSISIGSNFYSGSSCALVIHDENYTDATLLKASLNGKKVVYELATPLTIQLPTTVVKSLAGVNNISADSGDVRDGKYFAEL